MLALKIILAVIFLLVFYSMGRTMGTGRRLGRLPASDPRRGLMITKHAFFANTLFVSGVAAVLLTEIIVRLHGGVQNPRLFLVHICFAAPFFVSLVVLRFFITGVKAPARHRKLAYFCLGAFSGTLITGLPLFVAFF